MIKIIILFISISWIHSGCMEEANLKHVIVFKEEGRFAGWPANNGIWSWGNEILVGFSLGYFKKSEGHAIDREKPSYLRFARSLDGGETWKIEIPPFLKQNGQEPEPTDSPGGFDFSHPDFIMRLLTDKFYTSSNRGKSWDGPFKTPVFEGRNNLTRTDYMIEDKYTALAFMAAAKDDGSEGWPFCVRTTNGTKTWDFLSWIGAQPTKGGYAIMPSTVELADSRLLTMIRRKAKEGEENIYWIESYTSSDRGKSWQFLNKPTKTLGGNPAHLVKLLDGRLFLTYGYRRAPFGIRAKLSSDNGKTWGEEIILRDDGGNWDLGYPRAIQRPDSKIVVIYYFNNDKDGERYIGASILKPPVIK